MILDEVQDKDNKALRVTIAATAGSVPVTIVGGGPGGSGTEYTEGDVDASITGTAILWEDSGNTLRPVSAATPLPVSDAGSSLTVDGPLTDAQLRATPVPVSGTVTITDGSGPVTVDGTVAATQSGSWSVTADTELPAAAALADNTNTPTTPLVGVCNLEYDGSSAANWSFTRHSFYKAYTTISGAGALASVDMSDCPMSIFSVQEFKTGTVTAYNFTLEGSNDGGSNWFTLVNNTSASGADSTVFATGKPARMFRINVASKTGAGTIDIHVLACAR